MCAEKRQRKVDRRYNETYIGVKCCVNKPFRSGEILL